MTRIYTLRAIAACALMMLCATTAVEAQEFLDTAGRWKTLALPGGTGGGGGEERFVPRSMVALRGHVVIGREDRSVLVSRDSGETWTSVGNALPPEIQNVWALAHPDTSGAPNRIVGVAMTAASQARLIESSDGGITWRDAGRLPELDVLFAAPLDTMRLYGPPAIIFVPDAVGSGRTGFIYSAAGILVSTDGGTTWTRRGAARPVRAMAMVDDRNGIAAFGDYTPGTLLSSSPGGIHWTSDGGETWTMSYEFTDGGFYQYLTLTTFSATDMRAFVPERFQNYMDWRLLRSVDGGRSWGVHLGRQSKRPLYGRAFWRDTADIHVVSDGAILQHAADGGELFYLLRDTANGYWQTPLDLIPGYVTKAPIAATDGRYLYFTVPGNRAARWRMASMEPFASVDHESSGDGAISVVPNPTNREGARIEIAGSTARARELLVVDGLGRVVLRRTVSASQGVVAFSTAELGVGTYTAIVRSPSGTHRARFVVLE
jgi:photosystem II stability/assembly factor-like uncharacterized protein